MDKDDAVIEFYGPVIRIGVVGKWVQFIKRPEKRPTRKELLALLAPLRGVKLVSEKRSTSTVLVLALEGILRLLRCLQEHHRLASHPPHKRGKSRTVS
jgi:hypothetical protein